MSDNKQKLISLVSALEDESIIDYCYTFIGLKVYGKTRLPESITEELGQMWERYMLHQKQERREMTEEEKQAGAHRIDTVRMLFDIQNTAALNYLRIIVRDVLKECRQEAQNEQITDSES